MKLLSRGLVVLAAAGALVLGSLTGGAAAAPAVAPQVAAHHKTVRVCAAARPRHAACMAIRQVAPTEPRAFASAAVAPAATPSGFGPSSLVSAYKLPSGGSGQTVAIVDAQDDPNAESDLLTYRSQYGLPACTTANGCFRKVNQNGATSPLPSADTGWAGEESLDLDMVSAICPLCHIILVEATSASDANLGTGVNEAVALGARFVSNSYGGSESSSDTSYDSSYYNHPGVAVTASSGDSGYGTEYPAASQYVTAVGGTTLTTASNARGWNETAWSGAGSGCSAYDPKPSWQTVPTSCSKRAEADVSAVADPNTGVAVYQTYGASGWQVYGGTSVASPIIASVYALAGAPAAGTYPASSAYSHAANLFDVTSKSNGSCGAPLCTAGAGWDGPTGLGTPNGTAAFTSGGGTSTLSLANPGSRTGTVGVATSLGLSASGGTSPYTFTATGLPAGLSINASSGVISGTPTSAGTYSVTATVQDSASHAASASFSWVISGTGGGCTSSQLLGNPGFETGSASPWTSTAGVINANGAGETSHTGSYYAWLDGYGTTHTDTLAQTVTIPAACTHSTFSFWLHIDTAETTTTTAYDKLTVTVGSTTLATYSNLNKASGYVQHSFGVGQFAGQSVTIKFSGTEDSSLQTSFVVDDNALTTG